MYRQKTQIFRQNDFRQISTRYRNETRIVPVEGCLLQHHHHHHGHFSGAEIINKFYCSITTPCWNKAPWFVERSHMTFNIKSDSFTSAWGSNASLQFVYDISSSGSESYLASVVVPNFSRNKYILSLKYASIYRLNFLPSLKQSLIWSIKCNTLNYNT